MGSSIEELSAAVPLGLGVSAPLQPTQAMVATRAATAGDAQWIHNDPERARRESPFGGPVVQGFLLLAVLTRLSSGLRFPDYGPVAMLVNYGFDRVRFVRAVPVGAAVVLHGTLSSVRARDDGSAVLAVDVELQVEGEGAAAVAARWLFLAAPS